MLSTSLLFRTKDKVSLDKHRLIEILFKDWVDGICEQQVQYKVERDVDYEWTYGNTCYMETFRVDFEKQEDAVALKLRGVPPEFQDYLEIVG